MHPDPFALTPEEIAALPGDGGPDFNRLIFENSPYLLQHAANPVDWRPWGEEAFRVAAEQERPIFLSIGYATCHWCHVMAHESFEDPGVAGLLNTHFIPVKVDREERPDIDRIYMTVTQGLTGGGGWPMTVVLTPDARPFFAGTYFPRESRAGRLGMLDLLPQIQASWAEQREKVVESAAEITEWLGRASSASDPGELDASLLPRAFEQLAQRFDARQGGFGAAPKFPTPHNLSFLLRFWHRSGSEQALQMVETTLQRMRQGGIWDHIGYGFHRYSTDASWLVPHFEKMLYDQARMTDVYLDAYLATGNRRYAETARETLDYVLRDLTAPEGGFYSAEDADSEGEEGRFYLWTADEVRAVLGKDADLFMGLYGIRPDGNFDEEATGRKNGRNIPHLERPLSAAAAGSDDPVAYVHRVEEMRTRLLAARNERVRPLLDDKVLTDWNGLMISAMARGGRILGEDRFTAAATKAADFVLGHLQDSEARLLKRWRSSEAGLTAHLDDHVFLLTAFLDLYEATWDADWLQQAVRLAETMDPAFWDEEGGGYFFTAQDAEPLLVRSKEVYDGAIPSGNSMAAFTLMRLARMTGRSLWEERAVRTMESFGSQIARAPAAFTMMMCALDFLTGETREIVIAGEPGSADTSAFLEALRTRYLPGVVTLLRPEPDEDPLVSRLAPFTRGQRAREGRAAAYVCRNQTCDRPVSDPEAMLQRL